MEALLALIIIICLIAIISRALFTASQPPSSKTAGPQSELRFPGPRPLPFIGNVLTTPIYGAVLHFKQLTDKYGPIAETTLLGQRMILISKAEIADELLSTRKLSGRCSAVAVNDAQSKFGTAEYMPLMSFNADHHRHKKVGVRSLAEARSLDWRGNVRVEAARLMNNLARFQGKGQKEWIRMTEDLTSRVSARLTYGSPDEAVRLHYETWEFLVTVSPNGVLSNLIPALDKLPLWLSPWKIAEHRRHKRQQAWFREMFEVGRHYVASGTVPPCYTTDWFMRPEGKSTTYIDDEDAAKALGTIATIAIFTVSGPMLNVVRGLACFPEWQDKLLVEMEALGEGIPTLADLPRLPLLRAWVRESVRWRQAIPSGIPHEAEEDTWFRGVLIPKGTAVFALEYGINRDPDVYDRPYDFDPMRWLDPASPNYREPISQHPSLVGAPMFGWGRRYCMGHELAADELYIFTMHLVWSFHVKLTPSAAAAIEKDLLPGEKRGGHQWPRTWDQALIIMQPEPLDIEFHARKGMEFGIREEYENSKAVDCLRAVGRVNVE